MDKTMKTVIAGILEIAYYETGPVGGYPTVLLHGFPYDVHAYDEISEILATSGHRCIVPFLRGYGSTRFLSQETPRSGEQAALGTDLLALMDALCLDKAILGGYDWGGRAACIVAALWPHRVRGLVSCGGYNIQNIAKAGNPVDPKQEARLWYQYYFNTERGRAGLAQNRRDLCRYIWQSWSPTWAFDNATFDRTAAAFDNPDFVDVVIHSYRHRFGATSGDPALEDTEARIAEQPIITVPTIVLDGADNGVAPTSSIDHGKGHFTASYERRIVPSTGHNLPQEAPHAFAKAVLDLAHHT